MKDAKKSKFGYVLPVFRKKKFGDKTLVINEYGYWCATNNLTLRRLMRGNISKEEFLFFEKICMIVTPSNIRQIISDIKEKYGVVLGGTSLHIIITTLRCNQKCSYCHSSSKYSGLAGYDMTEKTAKKVINFIFQSPSENITIEFQGGESLLNKEIVKFIVREAKKENRHHNKKLSFGMTSNLTLIDKKTLSWFENEGVHICTSLDGNKKLHNLHRVYENGTGSYNDVSGWMDFYEQKYDRVMPALPVTTKKSLAEPKKTINEYVKRRNQSIQIRNINRLGFCSNPHTFKKIGYSVEEFNRFWEKCVDYLLYLNEKGVDISERHIDLILNKVIFKKETNFVDFRSPCGAVIGQICYDYNGDIYSCDPGRMCDLFRLGSVYTHNLREVITSKDTENLILASLTSSFACSYCIYHPFCGLCPTMTYYGEKNVIPKLPKNTSCKIYKRQFD
ncbi:radical SAM protein, partial [Candidatus Woesearchaeota archaeon]|nr:radical SAM protein [Candidatus Woesearchaeota archaeon]